MATASPEVISEYYAQMKELFRMSGMTAGEVYAQSVLDYNAFAAEYDLPQLKEIDPKIIDENSTQDGY